MPADYLCLAAVKWFLLKNHLSKNKKPFKSTFEDLQKLSNYREMPVAGLEPVTLGLRYRCSTN